MDPELNENDYVEILKKWLKADHTKRGKGNLDQIYNLEFRLAERLDTSSGKPLFSHLFLRN